MLCRKYTKFIDEDVRRCIYRYYLRARLKRLHDELLSPACWAGWSQSDLKASGRHSYGAHCSMVEYDQARTRFIRPEIRPFVTFIASLETLEQLLKDEEYGLAQVGSDYFLDGIGLYSSVAQEHAPYRQSGYGFLQDG